MKARTRLIVIAVLTVLSMTTAAFPQGRGRGGDPGQRGGNQGRGGQGGGRRGGGFPQFTREPASQDIVQRGKALYEENCSNCHAADLRGGSGPNLLRSGVALNDKKGELIGAAVGKHTPALRLVADDTGAIAEYIHAIHATMDRQGSPPGRNPVGLQLNLLVGDVNAGQAQFSNLCSSCHSVTGDLKGIGSKYPDVRTLQNTWFSGAGGGGGGGGNRGGGGGGSAATVTLADNTKLEGTMVLKNDFLVILMLNDGTRKSIPRGDVQKIEVNDPRDAHKNMAMKLIFDDPDNKKLHDITAYLASIK